VNLRGPSDTPNMGVTNAAEKGGSEPVLTIKRTQPKVGRNEPCPCRSGKKYKNCCGKE